MKRREVGGKEEGGGEGRTEREREQKHMKQGRSFGGRGL